MMISELQDKYYSLQNKYDALQNKYDEQKEKNDEIHKLSLKVIRSLRAHIKKYKQIVVDLEKERQVSEIIIRLELLKDSVEFGENYKVLCEEIQDSNNNLIDIGGILLDQNKELTSSNNKYKKCSEVLTLDKKIFWDKYRAEFNELLSKGKPVSWSLNKIKDRIVEDRSWVNKRKDIKCPHISTLRRQLVPESK